MSRPQRFGRSARHTQRAAPPATNPAPPGAVGGQYRPLSETDLQLTDEMHSHTYRVLRGVEVTEENLGCEAIINAVLGDGHFLGNGHTLPQWNGTTFIPSLQTGTSRAPGPWQGRKMPGARRRPRRNRSSAPITPAT